VQLLPPSSAACNALAIGGGRVVVEELRGREREDSYGGEGERTGGRGERLADARLLVVVSFNLKLCFRLDSL
jgi:hypothetical protein